jgi:pimeloyl-ACP methyl ester carboxylesterase
MSANHTQRGIFMSQTPPTIILVHGALTDASVWNGVSERLQRQGVAVLAPAMPLRSLAADADYLAAFLDTIEGPVVLAGHSYGGTIISHPATTTENLVALVFVSAFQPEAGESTGELNSRFPGSKLGAATTTVRPAPGGQDLYLKPEAFAEVYAADLPPTTVALMAAAQRPIDPAALDESFDGDPTWRATPSWTLVSTRDSSLPAEAQRFMAQRAGSTTEEVESSHASPIAQPQAVTDLILDAARHPAGVSARLTPR